MSRVLFRQIPKGARLLAMGNFFKESVPDAQWRLAVFLNQGSDMLPRRFGLEMLCVMGLGREFIAEDKTPYISHGFLKAGAAASGYMAGKHLGRMSPPVQKACPQS